MNTMVLDIESENDDYEMDFANKFHSPDKNCNCSKCQLNKRPQAYDSPLDLLLNETGIDDAESEVLEGDEEDSELEIRRRRRGRRLRTRPNRGRSTSSKTKSTSFSLPNRQSRHRHKHKPKPPYPGIYKHPRPHRRHRPHRPFIVREPAEPCICPAHGTEFVRWVQSSLNQILGLRLVVNGIMNRATRNAVREFQKKERLPVDGIAGPETKKSLVMAKGSQGENAELDSVVFNELDDEFTEETTQAYFILDHVKCYKTEDYLDGDECRLQIFVDGKLKKTLERKLKDGQLWNINLKLPFHQKVVVKLWDDDTPPFDPNDFIGQLTLDKRTTPESNDFTSTKQLRNGRAHYSIKYNAKFSKKPFTNKERVVFIPGFMGSKLVALNHNTNKHDYIWSPPKLHAIDLFDIRNMGNGYDSGGGVQPKGVITFGNVYDTFLERLRVNTDLLEFSYDWRLSNAVNAANLYKAIRQRCSFDNNEEIDINEKVTIITHSMGGLVARHFIEAGKGVKYVKCFIGVGVPNLGVPEAFLGMKLIGRPAYRFSIKNFSSVVEMLPIFPFAKTKGKCLSLRETYKILERRLSNIPIKTKFLKHIKSRKMSVYDILLNFRLKLKDKSQNLDTWLSKNNIRYYFIGSTGLKTEMTFELTKAKGLISRVNRSIHGDDTVPIHSALMGTMDNRESMIARKVFPKIKHRNLFSEKIVQNYCFSILKIKNQKSP